MSFVDMFIAEIISLQVAVYHAHARLEANVDTEALHDLRIAVRRIRSLLRPIRARSENAPLSEAAAATGRLTTSARDLEVMIAELQSKGVHREANARKILLNDIDPVSRK